LSGLARRTRAIAALLSLIAVAGLAAGCSSGGPEQVRFYISKPEAIPYFRDLVEKYNASQNEVHVVMDT
jgi:raffinose/stachyose/melibiose transport system substrate-binding protein